MRFHNWKAITNLDLLENSKEFEDIIKSLNEDGGHMWKVRGPSKIFRRKFSLDLSDLSMKYEPTSKSPCFSKNKQNIELGEIVEIRQGWKTDVFNKLEASESKKKAKKADYKGKVDEKSCFSIIYGVRRDSWDLVAPDPLTCQKWVRTLNHLLSLYRSKEEKQGYERWLRKQFNSADVDKSQCLNFPETLRLLKQLNIEMEEADARKLFHEANTRKSEKPGTEEVLDEDEFVTLYYKLLRRPDFERLFDSIAGSTDAKSVSANAVCEFLKREQGDDFASCTEEDCVQMIKIYEPSPELKSTGELSVAGFLNMLLSPQFDLFNAKHKLVYQDMTQPMSHYYITCSHNTYLLGHQLSGVSSVEGYVEALKRGCRFLELDCWDGEDNEPVITHGFTFTTKILFKDVLKEAVKPYSFVSSRYPVFLSLENHCSEPYQEKMAEHLRTILGDMLYTTDPHLDMENLPSPEEMQGKIFVKAKKKSPKAEVKTSNFVPPPALAEENENEESSSEKEIDFFPEGDTSTVNSIPGVDDGLIPRSPSWTSPPKASMESLDDSSDSDPDESIDYIDGNSAGTKRQGVSYDLSSLVNLVQGVHFHSFEDSRENHKCYNTCSLSESKAANLIAIDGEAFVEFNKRHLSKIFPSGSRTNSSNPDPIPFWNVGCQLVAMNYQTEDEPNFINHSLFVNNGSSGYVLKPDFLRDPNIRFNPKAKFPEDRGITLKVKIISGQHIPKAPGVSEVVDPYVEVKIMGHEQDVAKAKTKVVHNNGFNPIWGESFKFRIFCPELAMIYFRVRDYSQTGADLYLAHFICPLNSITTGYRHVHVTSLRGTPLIPSSLFVHITVQQHGTSNVTSSIK